MFENLEDTQSIDLEIELRIVHGTLIREVRGEVIHNLRMALEGLGEILLVKDVAVQEMNLRIPRDLPFVRRREIVQDENTLHIELGQDLSEIGADSARAAGHENGLVTEGFGGSLHFKPPSHTPASSNPPSVESPPRA